MEWNKLNVIRLNHGIELLDWIGLNYLCNELNWIKLIGVNYLFSELLTVIEL